MGDGHWSVVVWRMVKSACKNTLMAKGFDRQTPSQATQTQTTTTLCRSQQHHHPSPYWRDTQGQTSSWRFCSVREGVTTVFAYPSGASMEIHQTITCSAVIRNVHPCHEQGHAVGNCIHCMIGIDAFQEIPMKTQSV
ncbi:Agglutinin-like protein 1 precursor [Stylosanthes scabra]|uniref:Agglutinin-like protein 1 n=1 Tax=Stylosanthes scabra TaxID=79078 RepID=A0ABU6QTI9_9FABA|nr:Agglutinin-like protein 1 precursor [Stylosanthes scabra]